MKTTFYCVLSLIPSLALAGILTLSNPVVKTAAQGLPSYQFSCTSLPADCRIDLAVVRLAFRTVDSTQMMGLVLLGSDRKKIAITAVPRTKDISSSSSSVDIVATQALKKVLQTSSSFEFTIEPVALNRRTEPAITPSIQSITLQIYYTTDRKKQ